MKRKNELVDSSSVLECSSETRIPGVRCSPCSFFGDGGEEDVESGGCFVGEKRSENDLEVSSVTRTLRKKKDKSDRTKGQTRRGETTHEMMNEKEHVVRESFREEVGRTEVPSRVILRRGGRGFRASDLSGETRPLVLDLRVRELDGSRAFPIDKKSFEPKRQGQSQ